MSRRRLLFLGGNGHAPARLQPARDALATAGASLELVDVEVPGFFGRARAHSLDEMLAAIERQVAGAGDAVYATGIGGLLALGVRARTPTPPLLLQAPVLWGLQRRWMPRLMRRPPLRAAAARLFGLGAFQRWFWRRHVGLPWSHPVRAPFFDGYARCAAFTDLFRWISPAWLRELEAGLRARKGALDAISVWWGGRDTVVVPDELRVTEETLGVRWPLREFPAWGHYPMLTDAAGWVAALAGELGGDGYPPLIGGMNTISSPGDSGASNRS
jgi:hypothetical protein